MQTILPSEWENSWPSVKRGTKRMPDLLLLVIDAASRRQAPQFTAPATLFHPVHAGTAADLSSALGFAQARDDAPSEILAQQQSHDSLSRHGPGEVESLELITVALNEISL